MKKIIACCLVALLCCSCSKELSNEERRMTIMENQIENTLDSLCKKDIWFLDVIGETDEYELLVSSYDKYIHAKTQKDARMYFKHYVRSYNKCMKMYEDAKKNEF